MTYRVDLEPIGRRAEITDGQTLLDAARSAGVELVALCGGEGWCHGCVVRLAAGRLTPPTEEELDAFLPEQIDSGYRLACQAKPMSDVKVDIPPDSLTSQQRLSIEGEDTVVDLEPAVVPVELALELPTLQDLRADASRLGEAVAAQGFGQPDLSMSVLKDLSTQLRAQAWQARLALRKENTAGRTRAQVVGLLPTGSRLFGLAVDVGTTKLATYLVDLESGATVAKAGDMNPQIGYGEDVISRIAHCSTHADGRRELQSRLVDSLNSLVAQLCAQAGITRTQVVDAVIVGNTAMHHLFAGLPVEQLGRAPYVAAVSHPLDLPAREVGLELASDASIHLPANIAGFVGADHVAMALATGAWETRRTIVALDIGTNTEVTLTHGGRSWCCSCASGPAFEGAHIRDGMRAAPGAIERVQIVDGRARLKTIGDQPPVGICGSGILDAVGELVRTGIVDHKGVFQKGAPGVQQEGTGFQFVLAEAGTTGHGRPVVVTRKDINEIQLAKAAIRTGVDVLLSEAGLTYDAIEEFIIAGAFGTYLDVGNSVRIGLFPPLPQERFRQVGNAAGSGARQMLVSVRRRALAEQLAGRITYVELTVHPEFTNRYLKTMYF